LQLRKKGPPLKTKDPKSRNAKDAVLES